MLPLKAPSQHPIGMSRQPVQAIPLAGTSPVPVPASTTPGTIAPFAPKSLSHSNMPSEVHRYTSTSCIVPTLPGPANRYTSNYCPNPHFQPAGSTNLTSMAYVGKEAYKSPFRNCPLAIENSENTEKGHPPARSTSDECTVVGNHAARTSQANLMDTGIVRKRGQSPSKPFRPQQMPACVATPNVPPLAWSPPGLNNPRTCFLMKPQVFGAYKRLPGQRPCDPPCFSTTLQRQNIPFGTRSPTLHHSTPERSYAPYGPDTPMVSYGQDAPVVTYGTDAPMAYGALGDCKSRRTPIQSQPYKPMGEPVNGHGDDKSNGFNPYNSNTHHHDYHQ
jgi:hypothetical protein